MWLLKCIAGPVSEHPLAGNVLTGSKHGRTLQESNFIVLFYHSDLHRAGKRLS